MTTARASLLLALLGLLALAGLMAGLLSPSLPPEPLPEPVLKGAPPRPPAETLTGADAGAPTVGPEAGGAQAAPAHEARVAGLVIDASGRAVRAARLSLRAVDVGALRGVPAPDGALLAQTLSDDEGRFDLPAPAAPLARLVAAAPGLGSAAAFVDPAGARLTLRLASQAVLELRVVTEEERPVASASAQVRVARQVLDAEVTAGAARLEGLPSGPAWIRVSTPDGLLGAVGPVDLVPGQVSAALLVVRPGAWLSIQVQGARTQEPIAQAQVLLARPGQASGPWPTDADGRCGPVLAGLPGDALTLSVSAPGYGARLVPLTLADEEADPEPVLVLLEEAADWEGRVEDAAGSPVAAAQVGYTSDGIVGRAPAQTLSQADGRFRLPPPPPPAPGRQIVLVAAAPGSGAALVLRPGQAQPDPLVLRLAPDAVLAGRVTDGAGKALPGVRVRVQPAWDDLAERRGTDRLSALNAMRAGGLTALTDARGRWRLAGVPAGRYRLALERDALARTVGEPFDVLPGEQDLGTAVLGGGLRLVGRVLDAHGAHAAGARVLATAGPGEMHGVRAETGPDGRFELSDLAPGPVHVEATLDGQVRATASASLPTQTALDLQLPGGGTLLLTVTQAQGAYSGLLRLTLAREGRGRGAAAQTHLAVVDGAARWDGVPTGPWRLGAEGAGGEVGRTEAAFEIAPGGVAHAQVRLEAAGTVRGTLLTAQGAAVAGGLVRLREQEGRLTRSAPVLAGGGFTLLRLPPGRYELVAQGRGGAPATESLTLRPAETLTPTVRLLPAGSLRVRVLEPEGAPASAARVRVRPAQGRAGPPAAPPYVDAEGLALLSDLPLGAALVEARAADGRVAVARAEVVAGQTGEVELRLPAPR